MDCIDTPEGYCYNVIRIFAPFSETEAIQWPCCNISCRSAERFPDKCAVTDDVRSYTYAEFCHLTRAIGSGLLPLTRPRQAVGVYLPKNAQAVAAFGIQWAGCFYSC